jgi:mycofactocin precursor
MPEPVKEISRPDTHDGPPVRLVGLGRTDGGGSEEAEAALIEDELLVEEISIDGMCGVY